MQREVQRNPGDVREGEVFTNQPIATGERVVEISEALVKCRLRRIEFILRETVFRTLAMKIEQVFANFECVMFLTRQAVKKNNYNLFRTHATKFRDKHIFEKLDVPHQRFEKKSPDVIQ